MVEPVQYWQLSDGRVFPSREEAEAAEAESTDLVRAKAFADGAYPEVSDRERVRVRNVALEFIRWERQQHRTQPD